MYVNFIGPVGPGGAAAASLAPVSLDSSGVLVAPSLAAAASAANTAAGSPSPAAFVAGGSAAPVVLPWLDYGGGASGGPDAPVGQVSQWQTTGGRGSDLVASRFWAVSAGDGEPPWSNALVGRSGGCCGKGGGLVAWAKAHPWAMLGAVVAVVVVAKGAK
jgi:hypothetical protein